MLVPALIIIQKTEAVKKNMVQLILCGTITMKEEIVIFAINHTDGLEGSNTFSVGLDEKTVVQVIRVNGCHKVIVGSPYPHNLVTIAELNN